MKAVLLALVLSACTSLTDVSSYTFDVDPCGGPRPTCTGGRELFFVISAGDVPRKTADGLLDGFDLDASDRTICGQTDFVSPRGTAGVDNQVSGLATTLEMAAHFSIPDQVHAAILAGTGLQVINVQHVDDLANDDCVVIQQRHGYLPSGITTTDGNGDGQIDEGLTLDYGIIDQEDPGACIIDGELQARFPDGAMALPLGMVMPGGSGAAEFTSQHLRSRMAIDDSGLHGAVAAGSVRYLDLAASLAMDPMTLASFLATYADLEPSTIDAHDCQSISYALTFEAIPAQEGVLHR